MNERRLFVLVNTHTEELGTDLELAPEEATRINERLWEQRAEWRWVELEAA